MAEARDDAAALPVGGGTPAQQHRGTRAIQRMVEFAPATGGLALWVHHHDLPADTPATPDTPLVSTDGITLHYHPRFEALPLAEQMGRVAHEVLHIALRHPQRHADLQRLVGDVDLQLFNICADAIVNSTLGHLDWLALPAGSVTLEKLLAGALGAGATGLPGGEIGSESALLAWDVERLYRELDDRRVAERSGRARQASRQAGGDGGAERQRPRAGQGSAEQDADAAHAAGGRREDGPRSARARALGAAQANDLQPGADASHQPEADADAARTWSERLLRAHASDGLFSMLRTLGADLPRQRTPWEQVLRVQLARALSRQPALSWSRPARSYIANQGRAGPHRRLPWEPGFSGQKAVPRLVVVVDVSGSIADTLLQRFSREIEAITRRQEAGLVLVIGDERVQKVQRFEPGRCNLGGIAFQGGGGTDFTPLLEEADRHRPDLTVVLTDLDGPARYRPHSPVLWAVPETQDLAVAPFGRKLSLH